MIEKQAHDAEGSSPVVEFTGKAEHNPLSLENFLYLLLPILEADLMADCKILINELRLTFLICI
jgi:hypothetical protein